MPQLTQQGIAEEDADELLEKAFGWRSQVSHLCLSPAKLSQDQGTSISGMTKTITDIN